MVINLPIKVFRCSRADRELLSLQSYENLIVFHGKKFSKKIAHSLFPDAKNFFNVNARVDNLESTYKGLLPLVGSTIIAIGGGNVIDFSKRFCFIYNLKLVVIPTIISIVFPFQERSSYVVRI